MNFGKIAVSILILVVCIAGLGIYTAKSVAASSAKLENHITQIENSAKSGNWEGAKEELSKFESSWAKTEKTWALLLDHIEIDNIDSALVRVERFVEVQNTPLALGEAATLKQYIKHIPELQSFNLKNIL